MCNANRSNSRQCLTKSLCCELFWAKPFGYRFSKSKREAKQSHKRTQFCFTFAFAHHSIVTKKLSAKSDQKKLKIDFIKLFHKFASTT
jgi:anthranilate phosphoribosyltransferase